MSEILVTEHQLPVRTACRAVGLSRTAWYRRPADPATRDGAVVTALLAVVEQQGRWGFWKYFDRLRLDGYPWHHKRVHRVYCALRLNLPRRTKRRVPTRPRQPLIAPTGLNGIWALDFMQDALYGGRRFRTLNVLDEANREALAIEIGTSIPAARVVRVLEQLTRGSRRSWDAAVRPARSWSAVGLRGLQTGGGRRCVPRPSRRLSCTLRDRRPSLDRNRAEVGDRKDVYRQLPFVS